MVTNSLRIFNSAKMIEIVIIQSLTIEHISKLMITRLT